MNINRLLRLGSLLLGFAALEFLLPMQGSRNPQWCASADTIDTWQVYVDTVLVFRGPYPSANNTLTLERLRRGKTLRVIYRTDTRIEQNARIDVYRKSLGRLGKIASRLISRPGNPVIFGTQQLTGTLEPGDELVFRIEFPRRFRANNREFLRIP